MPTRREIFKIEFKKYLRESEKSYVTYAESDYVSNVVKNKTNRDSLFDLIDLKTIDEICRIIRKDPFNHQNYYHYSTAVQHYYDFIEVKVKKNNH